MAPYPDHTDYASPTSSSADRHQDGAQPTATTYMSIPSQYGGPHPVTVTVDVYGNTLVIYFDPSGNEQTSTIGTRTLKDGSFYTYTASAAAETVSNTSPYLTSGVASSTGQLGTSSTTNSPIAASGDEPQNQDHHHPAFPAMAALGIVIPSILIALSLCGFFFCIRPRQRRNELARKPVVAAHRVPEMKQHGAVGGPPMEHSQRAAGSPATSSSAIVSPATSSNARSHETPGTPPVILSTTMNNTYYTGIDTSDHISLSDQRSEASADTFGEEPPPPYRPRSVPPISREASLRNSMCRNTSVRSSRNDAMSGANLMGVRRSVDVRSPFDDPEDSDDDRLSQISTIRSYPRHDTDRLSVVSDLSYQEEPTSTHSTV